MKSWNLRKAGAVGSGNVQGDLTRVWLTGTECEWPGGLLAPWKEPLLKSVLVRLGRHYERDRLSGRGGGGGRRRTIFASSMARGKEGRTEDGKIKKPIFFILSPFTYCNIKILIFVRTLQ